MPKPFREDDWKYVSLSVPCLLAGLLIGHFLLPPSRPPSEVHLAASQYKYINPLLSCGDFPTVAPKDVDAAQKQVQAYIDKAKSDGSADDIAVYFRDLNNGATIGIDSSMMFSPGSLLKVPLLMSALTEAETNPLFLTKSVVYEPDPSALPQEIPAPAPLLAGKRYTLEQLVEAMITQSDNSSANLVYHALGAANVAQTYQDLALGAPTVGQDYSISVKQYATFFLYLYNSTYLSYPSSEHAMEILARSTFKDGLAAGVPANVAVAHKFGERETGTVVQLHDCGVVYAPNQPYILCVMTRGADITALSGVVKDLSGIVYTTVVKPS